MIAIIFYNNPIAKMIPPHEIEEGDLYIKSFKWREDEKPKIGDVVFILEIRYICEMIKIFLNNFLLFICFCQFHVVNTEKY